MCPASNNILCGSNARTTTDVLPPRQMNSTDMLPTRQMNLKDLLITSYKQQGGQMHFSLSCKYRPSEYESTLCTYMYKYQIFHSFKICSGSICLINVVIWC